MVYQRTFAQLSAAVQTLGSWENSDDITPDVLLQAVNYALIEGFDTMVGKWADYYTLNLNIPITTASDTYSLTSLVPDFYKLRHCDFSADGTLFRRMYPYDIDTQHIYSSAAASSSLSRTPRYRLQATNLVVAPAMGGTVKLYYIPLPVQFASTADATQVRFDAPTEERLVVHLAMRDLLVRSDLSTASVDGMIGRLADQLRTAADGRDAGEAFSLLDNPRRDYDDELWNGWY